jgi:hypothetical protein
MDSEMLAISSKAGFLTKGNTECYMESTEIPAAPVQLESLKGENIFQGWGLSEVEVG